MIADWFHKRNNRDNPSLYQPSHHWILPLWMFLPFTYFGNSRSCPYAGISRGVVSLLANIPSESTLEVSFSLPASPSWFPLTFYSNLVEYFPWVLNLVSLKRKYSRHTDNLIRLRNKPVHMSMFQAALFNEVKIQRGAIRTGLCFTA